MLGRSGIAFSLAFALCACAGVAENKATPTTERPATERPTIDKKTAEFVAKVHVYLEEARSAVRMVDLAPSAADFRKKQEKVTDALTRIPDPPSQTFSEVPALAKKASLSFDLAAFYLKLADDLLRLKGAPNYEKNINAAKARAAEAKTALDEIEKLLPED